MEEMIRLPPPEDLRAEVESSLAIGRLLFWHDLASAIGTDVMLANVPSPEKLGIASYLGLREADDHGRPRDSWLVFFFSAGDSPMILCTVRVPMRPEEKPEFLLRDPPERPPQTLRQWVRARETALKAIIPIAQPQNPVLLPGQMIGKEGILVYLLSGTTRDDVAVFGLHHRVLVSTDGETVVSVEPLTRSILEIPMDPSLVSRGLWVTHTVTEWPLETHVFVSLLHKLPVFVATSRGVWEVDGRQIFLLPEPPRKPWWRFW